MWTIAAVQVTDDGGSEQDFGDQEGGTEWIP